MAIIFVDTSWPVNTRTRRFYSSINKVHKECFLLGWNRSDLDVTPKDKDIILTKKAPYGNKFKKVLGLISFFFFLRTAIKEKKSNIVFCSHWDALLCTVLASFSINRKIEIVYDCLDMPSTSNFFVTKLIRYVERICINRVRWTLFASRFFPENYNISTECYSVYENYPLLEVKQGKNIENNVLSPPKCVEKKVISWIGVVRYKETLINLISAVSDIENYVLYVFGDGPDLSAIEGYVKDNNLSDKVYFFGRFESGDLPIIYNNTDLVWAAYPSRDENVRYAISNKYYESNFFNVIPIFSRNTKLGHMLRQKGSSVLLVDEYSRVDILRAIEGAKELVFEKYEEDVFWEDKEYVVQDVLKKIIEQS